MNYADYRISLDILSIASPVLLECKKRETRIRVYITLTEGFKPYTISEGVTAVFTAEKPDGNKLFNDCSIEGNFIVYTFTPQTTAAAGMMPCEIRLYGEDDELLISADFRILIHDAVYDDDDVVESAFESTTITKLVEEKVTEYLVENPIATDTTLTDPEAAANAKATGDAISALSRQTSEGFENTNKAIEEATAATNKALEDKVSTEDGKGLSANDFTNDYKTKLDGIEAGANKYELADKAVTPEKLDREYLTNDDICSPVVNLNSSATSRAITADDAGKTFTTLSNTTYQLSISEDADADIPVGFEVTALLYYGTKITISFPSSVFVITSATGSVAKGGSYALSQRGAAMVIKKMFISSGESYWAVIGDVEVV